MMATGQPHLVMLIEPETKIRFRYKSEGSSHGGLQGKEKVKGKKTFPTVKLEGYKGNHPVFIRVSLYTEDKKKHVLEFMGQSEESVLFIDQYLKEDNTAEFANLKFLSKKKEEIFRLLFDQRMKELGITKKCVRESFERQYNKEFKETAKNIMNSVRLCFEAFEKTKSRDIQICKPLFSEIIRNNKAASKGELRIHRMSRVSGTWKGDDEVILLCDKVQKDNIEIIFYEIGVEPDSVSWESKAIFTPADVHYQVAITFKTPQYRMNAEKTVFVCLSRNGEMGEPLEFTFIPDFEGNPSKRRKICPSLEEPTMSPVNYSDNSSFNGSEASSILDPQETVNDININTEEPMESLEFLKDFCNEMSELGVEVENFDQLYQDIVLPENCLVDVVFNQALQLPVDVTQIDGVVTEMALLTAKEPLNFIKRKTGYKTKSQKQIDKITMQIQQQLHSLLIKKDDSENTILHIAASRNKDVESILKLSRFAEIDIINEKNCHQEIALHVATKNNNKEVVKTLLNWKSNPNLKNVKGNNCYHLASENNHFDVMYYLLNLTPENRPELNAFNYEGLTPLHISVKKNSQKCYELLSLHSADVNAVDKKSGKSVLHYAVQFQPSFLKILLDEAKININIQDFEGNTPLHLACFNENVEIIKQLLKAGADPFMKNFKQNLNILEENSVDYDSGQMAQDLTTNSEIIRILKQAHCKIPENQEVMEKLYSVLDKDQKWKGVAIYVMDEKFISSLECSPSPTKALILHLQKEQENFMEFLKTVLKMTGPSEALDIINNF